GADTITLGAALTTSMTVDLAGGSDKLTLASATNTGSVANTESIGGGTGADTITLSTAVTAGSVDLAAGSDALTLANGTNSASIGNTETVAGGTGTDTITLS